MKLNSNGKDLREFKTQGKYNGYNEQNKNW